MFDAFRKFLSDCTAGDKHPGRFEENDYRLAASALLVHAAAIDGEVSEVGREKLHAVIKRRFELDEAATDELLAEATAAEHEAVDLYHFTSLINRSLDEPGRLRVVEMMWEIVFADGASPSSRTTCSGAPPTCSASPRASASRCASRWRAALPAAPAARRGAT